MVLKEELGLPNPIATEAHEAVMNIVVTAGLLNKEGERILKPFGLTEAQFNVLMLLRHQTERGEADQTTLGKMLVVNRSNVTGLIDRMERGGFVKREADPEDRRVNRVKMTKKGRAVLNEATRAYMKRIEEVLGGISRSKQTSLCRTLESLRTALRSHSGKGE